MAYSAKEQRAIREDIFRWLDAKLFAGTYEFSRQDLAEYSYQGERIPLVNMMRGIWNPKVLDTTLSILSTGGGRYDDNVDEQLFLRYSYQDSEGGNNVKLREAFLRHDPLVYFEKVRLNFYVARYPVYVVQDDTINRKFVIALDESLRFFGDPTGIPEDERKYVERKALSRVHQPMFRAKVMNAYSSTCAVCHLKHPELLDAAHIIPDSDSRGFARVTNGLALCKIHHAAYDRNLLGITPDFEVRIDHALLDEIDGPMLRHGLQDMHGAEIVLPKITINWPNKDNLAIRFEEFASR
jgi:putative restriction endonuclease